MRFFKEYFGIIWEFNSIKEFIDFNLGRLVGTIIGYIIVIILALMVFDWIMG